MLIYSLELLQKRWPSIWIQFECLSFKLEAAAMVQEETQQHNGVRKICCGLAQVLGCFYSCNNQFRPQDKPQNRSEPPKIVTGPQTSQQGQAGATRPKPGSGTRSTPKSTAQSTWSWGCRLPSQLPSRPGVLGGKFPTQSVWVLKFEFELEFELF